MKLTSATLADAAAIDHLVNSAYRGEYSKQGWTTEADLLGGQRTDAEKICEMITDPSASIQLLWVEQRLMGCVYLRREGEAVYLGMLTVEPTAQAKGYGSVMLEHAEQWAKRQGATRIKMTVIQGRDSLMAYYQRRGYELTGKTEPFPSDDPRFGIPKVPLLFLEMAKPIANCPT